MSVEGKKQLAEARKESIIIGMVQELKGRFNDTLSDVGEDLSPILLAQYMRETKTRLANMRKEEEDTVENRRETFRRKLQQSRPSCKRCGALLGLDLDGYAEERHQKNCLGYQEWVKKEEEQRARRRSYESRFDRALQTIQSISGDASQLKEDISSLKFAEAEAIESSDQHMIEAVQDRKFQLARQSLYDQTRRKKAVQNIRELADVLERWYRWLETVEGVQTPTPIVDEAGE
jgi:hypothetical protein